MSVINSTPLLMGEDGYQISRSVRLRSSASAYFNRTFVTPTSNTTWSWSGWVKLGQLGTTRQLFGGAGTNYGSFGIESTDKIRFWNNAGTGIADSTAVFRDPSAWYHIVVISNGTTIKAYVNNSEVLSYTGTITNINSAIGHQIGRFGGLTYYTDGYLTEVTFIDGQALTPSSFGETDVLTGVWKPKKYAGTYGTNGFYLNFSDNSNNTAATIGKDYSGNGNNWTPNNISVTSGATYDSMLDVPTMWADGGNGRGNYATLNPLMLNGATLSEANLKHTGTYGSGSTVAMKSGKWYCEFTCTAIGAASAWVGISDNIQGAGSSYPSNIAIYGNEFGDKYVNGSSASYGATWTTNDVIGCAYDADNNTITFYKNGTSQGTISSLTASTNGYYFFINGRSSTLVMAANFGQRPFSYTPPTGFKALNTQNLPDATIKKGNAYFDASLYTGNSSTQSVTNSSGFQPDLLWIKGRSASGYDNVLQDAVRGSTNQLFSNTTGIEESDPDAVTSFNSNGFSLGGDVTVNNSGVTFVGWQWKESVSAGFDIVTYTFSTGGTNTVNHSLGVAPKLIIMKDRTAAYNWDVYHASVGYTQRLILNSTGAATSGFWAAAPTSTQFSVTNTAYNNNDLVVAYLFAEVAGYSKFGSYTGNGSSDGPMVFLGFRPKLVLWKNADAAQGWRILDSVRGAYNVNNLTLYPNLSNAEAADISADFLSNGFKIRTTDSSVNGSGNNIIYAALAENPFKNSLAR